MSDPAPKKRKTEGGADTGREPGDDQLDAVSEQLGRLKEELEKLNEEASDKVLEIEQQYSKLRRPIYNKRAKLLTQVPNFWQQTLLRHRELRAFATEDDEAALAYCTEVDVEDFEDIKSGYRIIFRFSENPFFCNTELIKTFNYQPGGTLRIASSVPDWKAGYEPSASIDVEGDQEAAHEYKLFEWFSSESDEVQCNMVDDIAEIIKEEIWPDPIRFFEGEVDDDDEDGEGGFEIEEFEEEGSENEDDGEEGEGEEGGDDA